MGEATGVGSSVRLISLLGCLRQKRAEVAASDFIILPLSPTQPVYFPPKTFGLLIQTHLRALCSRETHQPQGAGLRSEMRRSSYPVKGVVPKNVEAAGPGPSAGRSTCRRRHGSGRCHHPCSCCDRPPPPLSRGSG